VVSQTIPDKLILQGMIVEHLVDPVITIDEQQNFLLVNKATATVFGYEHAELLKMSLIDLIPERVRDAHLAGSGRYIKSAGDDRRVFGYADVFGTTKSGEEIPLSLSMTCLKIDGQVFVTAFMRDMRALRASEKLVSDKMRELEAANIKLSDLADRDALTGALNRRAMERIGNVLWEGDTPFCVALCDIDHFKAYNDHYGHLAGDTALIAVAERLQHAAPEAKVIRFGGEEFLIFLPAARLSEAHQIVDAARHDLEQLAIPHAGSPVASVVTLSFGIASSADAADSLTTLIRRADDALYVAKRYRNRSVAWHDGLTS
jgi:diguanylate cyclase (GGDEF)-like protein/PAS domain S-box-containing protein